MSRVLRGTVATAALAGTVAVASYGLRRRHGRASERSGSPEPFGSPEPPAVSLAQAEPEAPPGGAPATPSPGAS
jgi:hypothetical protein